MTMMALNSQEVKMADHEKTMAGERRTVKM